MMARKQRNKHLLTPIWYSGIMAQVGKLCHFSIKALRFRNGELYTHIYYILHTTYHIAYIALHTYYKDYNIMIKKSIRTGNDNATKSHTVKPRPRPSYKALYVSMRAQYYSAIISTKKANAELARKRDELAELLERATLYSDDQDIIVLEKQKTINYLIKESKVKSDRIVEMNTTIRLRNGELEVFKNKMVHKDSILEGNRTSLYAYSVKLSEIRDQLASHEERLAGKEIAYKLKCKEIVQLLNTLHNIVIKEIKV